MISVVIPAHNEERVLPRLLDALLGEAESDEWNVVVVANGCSDGTADVARSRSGIRVIETSVASKGHALRLGDQAAKGFPRLYVDADVVIDGAAARALAVAVQRPGVLAAGPVRDLDMTGVPVPVRWYYDVWQRLPGVATELFGRGVIAVAAAGHARLSAWTEAMSDDLAAALSFGPDEIAVVPSAPVVIRPPRTYSDLIRRRTRAVAGNAMLVSSPSAPTRRPPQTGMRDLVRIAAADPRMIPKVAVFAATALLVRIRARRVVRHEDTTWLRDESSRA